MALFMSERFCQFTTNILLLLLLNAQLSVETSARSHYEHDGNPISGDYAVDFRLLSVRVRREVAQPPADSANITSSTQAPAAAPLVPSPNATTNKTVTSPLTSSNISVHDSTTLPSVTTTTTHLQIPNVGVNGTGIHKDVNQPKVSDPIVSDDDATNGEVYKRLPNVINPADLNNMTLVNHTFYNSSFIGQPEYFQELWVNISKMKFEIHPILSASHRRAATVTLSFDFPFYGHSLKNVTVATGGFIYMGEHVHNWLAATQYIAPLMANFDTRETNDSVVKIADDGTNFTVIWENVTLHGFTNKSFTFAVILRKDGDIFFVYKDVPIPVQYIEDKDHPVKVGISDAYLQDRVIFYRRRKTIFEYHRVNFMDHNITTGTVLRLYNLPTCLIYTTCQDCMNHKTSFNCTWCSAVERCSSGTDRNKQEWLLRNCDKSQITKEAECPPLPVNSTVNKTGESTSYGDTNNPYHNVIMRHDYAPPVQSKVVSENNNMAAGAVPVSTDSTAHHSSLSGVVVAFATVVLLAAVASWIFYAYKNPHTRSGQLLIKYRPSMWSWKRGEARYTAATIHM